MTLLANAHHNPFSTGDRVYLRQPEGRCDQEWSGPHEVTAIISSVAVVLDGDGVSRHVSHLRLVPRPVVDEYDDSDEDSDDDTGSFDDVGADDAPELRRGTRIRKPPAWLKDYDRS